MGLDYETLINKRDMLDRKKLYRENSNVLCYYIITAALLSQYPEFMEWCLDRNEPRRMLKFNKADGDNFERFGELISKIAKSENLLELLCMMSFVKQPNNIKKSLTMSAINGVN